MAERLTFEEFQHTRVWTDDLACIGFDDSGAGFVYDGGTCYLQRDAKVGWFLVIYNMQWVGELEDLEKTLYEEFYLKEIAR